ncbi:MAG: LamG domain-containing protein, partial [Holophagales bacterium]|nr:LamG domain-containing protein [Holophagales bacterium]
HIGGRSVSPAGRYFEGRLDDIRLYTRPLEAAEARLLGFEGGPNDPPTVNAGPDLGVLEGEDLLLFGAVYDEGRPEDITFAWSQVSGPGTVTFGHPGSPVTAASYDLPGLYVLRASASDSQGSHFDDVALAVQGASDPVGRWRLDEASGTSAADSSVQGNTGALATGWGALPLWTGSSLAFDGSTAQSVVVGRPEVLDLDPAVDDISLVAWIKAAPGSQGTLISKAYGWLSRRQYQLYLYDANRDGTSYIYGLIGGRSNSGAVGVTVDDDAWHLVAVVHDSATRTNRMYVDGVQVGPASASGTATNNVDVMLGARRNSSGNTGIGWPLTAELADARIYAWALSDQDMAELWAAGAPDAVAPVP